MADDKPIKDDAPVAEDVTEESPEAPVETPQEPIEATPEEQPEEETPEEPRAEPEPVEEPKQPSRREQLRVQDLLKKYGPPTERAPLTTGPDFRDKVQADEEVYKTLEETAKDYGQNQFNQGLERAKYYQWETLLNVDEPQVRSKYPILDPNSGPDVYHPAVTNAMYAKYARVIGYDPGDAERGIPPSVQNPTLRYADFVEAEMEFADELAAQKVERTTQNIAKQAAQTGLRPDGSSAKSLNLNKDPGAMTNEELNAVIKRNLKI